MQDRHTDDSAKAPNRGTALMMFGTIADTTWRLFVPVFVLFGIGLYIDNKHHQKPIVALIGTILGALLGFLLVRQQYRQIINGEKK